VAGLWESATIRRQLQWNPEDRGWKKVEDTLTINCFDGHQVPHNVEELLLDENTDTDDTASS